MDIFDSIKNRKAPLGIEADKSEGYFVYPKLEGDIGNRMMFNGKEVIVWSINDYLGLANLPEVRAADAEAAEKWGLAYPMGSRLMSGHTSMHEQLEQELADYVNKESAYLLNFGYQGFMSVIDALVTRRDVIVYDAEAHACLIDAFRMHLGKRMVYEHNNIESLKKQLKKAETLCEKTGGGILVISEGVFGMRGDQGKLKEIVALKKDYTFRLLVDDAHGFGVLGATGAGTGEEQGVQDGIDVYMATFAKSMASLGAFVATEDSVLQYLKYSMRSQIYAKSLPMVLVEGALRRLSIIRKNTDLKDKLWRNVSILQKGLRERGFEIGITNSCVTPVFMQGELFEAAHLVFDLRENYKILCSLVVYPVVPRGTIILRLIPTASHTEEDIQLTLEAFSSIKERLERGDYKKDYVPEVAEAQA